ncbi:7666_t:CDS:2 [Ambispora gerdemannii]|uniref:7666_t:CDS:1 n=1 Tax=Ambispora gerdemannii TaxID=144530 RepID=A0A9N9G038_9GLOM|nr:7666_t:CDS:2 [Ambispora gerdemannii]
MSDTQSKIDSLQELNSQLIATIAGLRKENAEQIPGTKRENLYKKTYRARKIHELFEKIGVDKIKYIKTYSANSISELSDSQIQIIIDYFFKNPNAEFPDNQDSSINNPLDDLSETETNITIEESNVQHFLPPTSNACGSMIKVSAQVSDPSTLKANVSISPTKKASLKVKSETSESPQSKNADNHILQDSSLETQVRVPQINILPISSKRQFLISVIPKDPEERQQHVIKMVLE